MNVCKRHARRQANSHLEQIVIVGIADKVEEIDRLVEIPNACVGVKRRLIVEICAIIATGTSVSSAVDSDCDCGPGSVLANQHRFQMKMRGDVRHFHSQS